MAEQLATIAPVRAARARRRLPRRRRGDAQVVETTIDRVLRDRDVRPLAGRRIEAVFLALAIEGSDGGPARVAARAVAHDR